MANEITDPTLYEKENQASILSWTGVSSPSQNRASKYGLALIKAFQGIKIPTPNNPNTKEINRSLTKQGDHTRGEGGGDSGRRPLMVATTKKTSTTP